jgi:hypothetical protein
MLAEPLQGADAENGSHRPEDAAALGGLDAVAAAIAVIANIAASMHATADRRRGRAVVHDRM